MTMNEKIELYNYCVAVYQMYCKDIDVVPTFNEWKEHLDELSIHTALLNLNRKWIEQRLFFMEQDYIGDGEMIYITGLAGVINYYCNYVNNNCIPLDIELRKNSKRCKGLTPHFKLRDDLNNTTYYAYTAIIDAFTGWKFYK